MAGSQQTVVGVRLIVTLLVVLIFISLGTLVGVVVRPPPPPDCRASLTLVKITVVQDTDPDSVYGPNTTDSWRGNLNFSVSGSGGVASLGVEVDFEGDIGHVEPRADVADGKVATKGETVHYLFVSNMTERDGASYTGPAPWDFDPGMPLAGPLSCPGIYRLSFPSYLIPLNNGEVESMGWLSATYLVVLDP